MQRSHTALPFANRARTNQLSKDKSAIIVLKYQDRSKWYRPLIQKGIDYLDAAAEPFEESPYHLEAAIASLHAAAPSFEKTDWKTIYNLYELLYKMQPNAVVALNKAIASAYAISTVNALEELQQIKGLEQHYLYYASIGEMYFEMKNRNTAKDFFKKALPLTSSAIEKKLLQQKISLCEN
jgi:RNA polymerase sigma-70 factor (ECF subfamily)